MVGWIIVACAPHAGPPGGPDDDPGGVGLTAAVASSRNPEMALEERFAISLSEAATVDLRCTNADDPLEDHRLSFTGTSGEVRLYGVLPGLTYDCVLTDADAAVVWQGSFDVGPLPDGFPELVVSGDAAAAQLDEDYLLFNHWKARTAGGPVDRLIITDGEGRIRWYQTLAEADSSGIAASWLAEDGLILVGGGVTLPPSLRTLSGDVVWQAPPPLSSGPGGYHHEALRTPDGWIVSLQGTPEVDGEVFWEGFRIEARDPATDALTWEFDSRPWSDAGVLARGTLDDVDPHHANALAWVDDDPLGPSVWVSLRNEQAMVRIDRASGEITHLVGPGRGLDLVDSAGARLGWRRWFYGQHDPEISGSRMLLFDNGSSRPGSRFSRVAQLRMLSSTVVGLEWEWSEAGWFEANFGAVQTLSEGRVLVASGHSGSEAGTSWIAEIDQADHAVVWRLDFSSQDDSIYRAAAIDGCAIFANARTCPDLAR